MRKGRSSTVKGKKKSSAQQHEQPFLDTTIAKKVEQLPKGSWFAAAPPPSPKATVRDPSAKKDPAKTTDKASRGAKSRLDQYVKHSEQRFRAAIKQQLPQGRFADFPADAKRHPWTVLLAIKANRLRSYYEIPDEDGLREHAVGVALEEDLLDSFSQQLARPFPELVKQGDGPYKQGSPRVLVKTAIEVGAIGAFSEIPAIFQGDRVIVKAVLEKQIAKDVQRKKLGQRRGLEVAAKTLSRGTGHVTDLLGSGSSQVNSAAGLTAAGFSTVLRNWILPFGTQGRLQEKFAQIAKIWDVEDAFKTNIRGDKGLPGLWKGKGGLVERPQQLVLPRKDFRMLLAAAARILDFADRHQKVKRKTKTPGIPAAVNSDLAGAARRVAGFLPKAIAYLLENSSLDEQRTSVTLTLPAFRMAMVSKVFLLLKDQELFELLSPDQILQNFSTELSEELRNDKELALLALRAGAVTRFADLPAKLQQDLDVLQAALVIDGENLKKAKQEVLDAGIAQLDLEKKLLRGGQEVVGRQVWEELDLSQRQVVRMRETGKISEEQRGLTQAEAEQMVEGVDMRVLTRSAGPSTGNRDGDGNGKTSLVLAEFLAALPWVDNAPLGLQESKNREKKKFPKKGLRLLAAVLRRVARKADAPVLGAEADAPSWRLAAASWSCSCLAAELEETASEGNWKKKSSSSSMTTLTLTPGKMGVVRRGLSLLKLFALPLGKFDRIVSAEQLAFDRIVSAKSLASSLSRAKVLNLRNKDKIVPLAVKAGLLPKGEWKQQQAFLKRVLLQGK
eukprot:g17288.t1